MAHAMAAVNLVLCIPFRTREAMISVQSIKFVAPMQINLYQMTIERAMQKFLVRIMLLASYRRGGCKGKRRVSINRMPPQSLFWI